MSKRPRDTDAEDTHVHKHARRAVHAAPRSVAVKRRVFCVTLAGECEPPTRRPCLRPYYDANRLLHELHAARMNRYMFQ